MAYYATSPRALEGDPTPENRVWGFFADPNKSRLPNRLQSPQPRRRNRATTTRTASGIPLWPSRDPIEEAGGVNFYNFVENDPLNKFDRFGLAPVLSFTTDTSSSAGLCGGAVWRVRWQVQQATVTAGTIYQQITTTGWESNCSGPRKQVTLPDFTEYWIVSTNGQTGISTISDGSIDTFGTRGATCTKGDITVTANARYADGVIPNAPAARGQVNQAGNFWAELGHVFPQNASAFSNFISRSWRISWDCCKGLQTTTVRK